MKAQEHRFPTFLRLFTDSFVLKNKGTVEIDEAKKEAARILSEGPSSLTIRESDVFRYKITNNLVDLETSDSFEEKCYIISELQIQLYQFLLLKNNQWLGEGKHLIRELKNFNPKFCSDFISSTKIFYLKGNYLELINTIDKELHKLGGRLKESKLVDNII
ncbi:MAG: hypothetical protein GY795_42385 [Desulfobacterales bacterium]|nr:hypothetical protein [Desulfobacterales bacterium]